MTYMTIYATTTTLLPGGEKMVRGYLTFNSGYGALGGQPVNLSNHFLSSTVPTVLCAPINGYTFHHNMGNAVAGKIRAMYIPFYLSNQANANVNVRLEEVIAGTDLSGFNVPFFAIGQAY